MDELPPVKPPPIKAEVVQEPYFIYHQGFAHYTVLRGSEWPYGDVVAVRSTLRSARRAAKRDRHRRLRDQQYKKGPLLVEKLL